MKPFPDPRPIIDLGSSEVRASGSTLAQQSRQQLSAASAAKGGFRAGTLVAESLRLKRVLGRGAMGWVWVAHHLALDSDVAVKFISADVAKRPEAFARFTREATAAAQIDSPHIVRVFDYGVTAEGVPYSVMELLDGEDLGARLERLGPMPLTQVTEIVSQTCKALARAHALGIVHRDVKPANIFLVGTGTEVFVKVLDFGIAKHTKAESAFGLTSTGLMVGTPYYMGPEQILSSKDVDFRADLWSLAVVAYYSLTGVVPFDGETLGALCIAIDRGEFQPPSRLRPDLPPSIDGWFARALNRNLFERFSSAKEMADALLRAIDPSRPESNDVSTLRPQFETRAFLPGRSSISVPPMVASTASSRLAAASALPFAIAFAVMAVMATLALGTALLIRTRGVATTPTPVATLAKILPAFQPLPSPADRSLPEPENSEAPEPTLAKERAPIVKPRASQRAPSDPFSWRKTPRPSKANQSEYGF